MKKIGILTFHRALNVGACIQAFALNRFFKKNKKIDVEIIDYINKNFKKQRLHSYEGNNIIKRIGAFFLYGRSTRKKRILFDVFIQRSAISKKKYNEKNIHLTSLQYDCIIVGSDQVFNPTPSKGDSNYLLSFVTDSEKKYSFAASIGINELDENLICLYKKYLNDFKVLSIRENTGVELLKKIGISSRIRQDIDPTFLFDINEWKQLINYVNKNKTFIFIYEIFYDEVLLDKAIEYSKKYGVEIYSNVQYKTQNNSNKVINIIQCEPQEWLECMIGATTVFTNSFHGVAFSINFEKHFFVNKTKNEYSCAINSRITDLLDKTDLGYKYVSLEEVKDDFYDIKEDYARAKKLIKTDIDNSKEYLLSFGD